MLHLYSSRGLRPSSLLGYETKSEGVYIYVRVYVRSQRSNDSIATGEWSRGASVRPGIRIGRPIYLGIGLPAQWRIVWIEKERERERERERESQASARSATPKGERGATLINEVINNGNVSSAHRHIHVHTVWAHPSRKLAKPPTAGHI